MKETCSLMENKHSAAGFYQRPPVQKNLHNFQRDLLFHSCTIMLITHFLLDITIVLTDLHIYAGIAEMDKVHSPI